MLRSWLTSACSWHQRTLVFIEAEVEGLKVLVLAGRWLTIFRAHGVVARVVHTLLEGKHLLINRCCVLVAH